MNRLEGRFAARQIPGKREYQEDDYGLIEGVDSDSNEVLVIADGMGGQVGGDTASRTVIKTFIETYSDTTGLISDRLRACLMAANNALSSAIDAHPALDGMGTTVVAVVISQRGLEWISVGDSPLWLFREGQLRRLNADHSMAAVFADLVAVGRMTQEEAATDPKRHALRSAVMGDDIHLIDVSSQPVALKRGDRVVLASDGLLTLADDEIARILQTMQAAPLSEVSDALIHAVEDAAHPHQDNTTVLLYTPDADKGVDAVIADTPEGKSRPDHQQPNRIRQLFKKKRDLRLVEIALGVVFLALLYWFWPSTSNTPPTLTETLPPKDTPVLPEASALLNKDDPVPPEVSAQPKEDGPVPPEAPAKPDEEKVKGELTQIPDRKPKIPKFKLGTGGEESGGSGSGNSKSDDAESGGSGSGGSGSGGPGGGASSGGAGAGGASPSGANSGGSGSGGSSSGGSGSGGAGSGGAGSGGAGAGGSGSSGSGSGGSSSSGSGSGGSGSGGGGTPGSKPGGKAGETKSEEKETEKPTPRRKRRGMI